MIWKINIKAFILSALIIFASLSFSFVRGQIVINEILASNTITNIDPDFGEYGDWIELYNNGRNTVDIGGYFLSDNTAGSSKYKWAIPNGTLISPGAFLLIWADNKNVNYHTNYQLSSTGETVVLFDNIGLYLDSIQYPEQREDYSYGRQPDGSTGWYYLETPTPMATNSSNTIQGVLMPPVFSLDAGFYSGGQVLTMTADNSSNIRYTIDGSKPTDYSNIYNSPININETVVIKVFSERSGYFSSNVVTKTFIINENTELPVISLSTDPYNLWDIDSGIYVVGRDTSWNWYETGNYMQNWEKPVHVEFFETDGKIVLDQDAGLKIAGAVSRTGSQKSLRIIARSGYGPTKFNHKVFEKKDIDTFNSLRLRCSGNDWYNTMMADGLLQTMVRGQMDIDLQAYQPSVVFLNGKYWGIHNIREHLGGSYAEENYGVDGDNIDFLSNVNWVRDGDFIHYGNMHNFMKFNDMSDPAVYEYVETQMDVHNFIDYYITEIFYGNFDWPAGNIKFWRPKTDNGRWRWMLLDLDMSFRNEIWGQDNLNRNHLIWASDSTYQTIYNGIHYTVGDPRTIGSRDMFAFLLENDEFRESFAKKFYMALNTVFEPELVITRIDSVQSLIENEMPKHINLWRDSTGPAQAQHNRLPGIPDMQTWESNIEDMRTFARARSEIVRGHLNGFFNLGIPYDLSVTVESPGSGRVELDSYIIPGNRFNGTFFQNIPVNIKAYPNNGYSFVRFEKSNVAYNENDVVSIFSKASVWYYYDKGNNLGTAWKEPGFDHSSWDSGSGIFGYYDPDIITEIDFGPDGDNKYITTYFRKSFQVEDKTEYKGLIMYLLRDDGAIVYLNGHEVIRDNMPPTSDYQTLAISGTSGDDENTYFPFNIATTYLVNGLNTIAVEVHQVTAGSSDLSFDFELKFISTGTGGGGTTEINDNEFQIQMVQHTTLKAIFEPSGQGADLVINEFLANNAGLNTDEAGEYNDWIEIYNPGNYPYDIGGMYLTDNLAIEDKWRIPSSLPEITTIPAKGYLLFWADNETDQGPLHLNFRLNTDLEEIGLFKKENNQMVLVSSVSYSQQQTDVSYGRYPDGSNNWEYFYTTQSPGESNRSSTGIFDISEVNAKLFQNFPNPFRDKTTIKFIVSESQTVIMNIIDITGRIIRTRNFGLIEPGKYYDYEWDGTDIYGNKLSTGMYFYTLTGNYFSKTQKAVYIKDY